jgi:hypothetical protein
MNCYSQITLVLFAFLCVLFGCSAPPPTIAPTAAPSVMPTETATLAPTATPTMLFREYPNMTPEFIPSPTPPAALYSTQDTLREFPLRLGATWVYSWTQYDTLEGGGLITTTWRVTDTVAAVETRDSMYAAHVVRSTTLLNTTRDLDTLPFAENYFSNMRNPQAHWLIVDENKVYQPWDSDWKNVENSSLNYIFPLAQNNRWYPNVEQRALFSPYRDAWIPGVRIVTWQGARVVLASSRENCFEIQELYNSGATREWFCAQIGRVAEQYDHSGTRFGFRSELIQFIPGE